MLDIIFIKLKQKPYIPTLGKIPIDFRNINLDFSMKHITFAEESNIRAVLPTYL